MNLKVKGEDIENTYCKLIDIFISGGPENICLIIKKMLEDNGHEVIPFHTFQ